jgi:hypothetical protein
LSESANEHKAFTGNVDAMSRDEDEGKGEDSELSGSSPPKCQLVVKGKAKLVKYDLSDAKFQGNSEDDYKPA